jgi:O-6-methylguanine DNA methyltransferase
MMSQFSDRVIDWVKKIPKGKTASYGEIATLAGEPMAARAVGNIMGANQDPKVPCHRVIYSDGRVGRYNGNLGVKEDLLKNEGVNVTNGKIVV